MLCENCGTELRDRDQFCPSCGFQLKTKKIQFNSNEILYFRDPHTHKIWIWQGSKCNMRDKFLTHLLFGTHKKLQVLRNVYANDYTIEKMYEGSESLEFKIMITRADIVFLKNGLRDFKSMVDDLDIDSFEKGLEELKLMIRSTITKELTLERKNLPEILSLALLEISEEDKLPRLKEIVLEYYRYRGLIVKLTGNVLELQDSG